MARCRSAAWPCSDASPVPLTGRQLSGTLPSLSDPGRYGALPRVREPLDCDWR